MQDQRCIDDSNPPSVTVSRRVHRVPNFLVDDCSRLPEPPHNGYRLRDAINAQGVEARSILQDDALRSNEQAQEALAVLGLLANPDERTSFRAFLGFGDPDGRCVAYARLSETAHVLGVSERQALERVQRGQVKLAATAFVRRLGPLGSRVAKSKSPPVRGHAPRQDGKLLLAARGMCESP